MNINDTFTIAQYDEAYQYTVEHEYTTIVPIGNDMYRLIEVHKPTEEELAQQEKERISKLHLTKREVFLGLLNALNVMPDQIREQIVASGNKGALIEFDYATEYYRGNPLIDLVGEQLGITPKQLDRFFETNDYEELISVENK